MERLRQLHHRFAPAPMFWISLGHLILLGLVLHLKTPQTGEIVAGLLKHLVDGDPVGFFYAW